MVLMPVRCPPCHRDHGITGGKTTWGTDARHLDPEAPHAGQHHTQHSERTQLPLRTRITR
jgi:hypothetical protein